MSCRVPPRELLDALPQIGDFASRLIGAWDQVGRPSVTCSSWYRNPQQNRLAGGAPRSQHQLGLGVDIVGDGRALRQMEHATRVWGLVPVMEPGHLHVQAFTAGSLDFLWFDA